MFPIGVLSRMNAAGVNAGSAKSSFIRMEKKSLIETTVATAEKRSREKSKGGDASGLEF